MTGRIFYFVSALLFLFGIFILLTPSLISPDLIYPERIDSTYIKFHTEIYGDNEDSLMLTPSDLKLEYENISLITKDDITLNGWYVATQDTPANTIIILHDVNESKILYLDHVKQFHDRGLNVCIFDQRAHGSSGGNEFTPGLPAVEDVKLMIDSVLARKQTKNIILFGCGIGSAIALQTAVYDNRSAGLILQSPFNTYENYLQKYARMKWGFMKSIWYPVFKRKAETLLHYSINELDLRQIAAFTSVPSLFVIGSDDEKVFTSETLQVFDASATEKKELFLIRNAGHENIAKAGGAGYYNRIAAFIIMSMPKEQKITRYKKLALE